MPPPQYKLGGVCPAGLEMQSPGPPAVWPGSQPGLLTRVALTCVPAVCGAEPSPAPPRAPQRPSGARGHVVLLSNLNSEAGRLPSRQTGLAAPEGTAGLSGPGPPVQNDIFALLCPGAWRPRGWSYRGWEGPTAGWVCPVCSCPHPAVEARPPPGPSPPPARFVLPPPLSRANSQRR